MAKGTVAAVFMISLLLAMTILNGVGYYALMGSEVDVSSQNADVQAAAEQVSGVSVGEGRSAALLQGPLAAVTPALTLIQSFTTVIGNTSGVLQLLYGLPAVAADAVETFFRIGMLVTVIYLLRSGSPV